MKKTVITLMATAALAGAVVAPVVAVKANDTYTIQDQKATQIVAEIGREYALAFANAASAKNAAETTAQILFSAQQNRDAIYSAEDAKVAAAQQALDAAKTAWQIEKENAVRGEYADETERNLLISQIDSEHGIKVADAEDVLAAAIEAANEAKAKADKAVAEAQADYDKAQADLAAAVAEKERLYNAFIGAGATGEQVKEAETTGAVSTPAGQNAGTSGSTKSEATSVKAANTATSSKALPKTSAAK